MIATSAEYDSRRNGKPQTIIAGGPFGRPDGGLSLDSNGCADGG
jgi:hypothetical protein